MLPKQNLIKLMITDQSRSDYHFPISANTQVTSKLEFAFNAAISLRGRNTSPKFAVRDFVQLLLTVRI